MSYQEKKSVVNILSSVVLTGVYALVIYNMYQGGSFDTSNIFRFWALIIVIFIPISVVAKIIIEILFSIGNAIGTEIKNEIKGTDDDHYVDIVDERDKLISLKSSQVSYGVFVFGFLLALVSQLLNMDNNVFFITLVLFGLISDVSSGLMTIRYYRRGV